MTIQDRMKKSVICLVAALPAVFAATDAWSGTRLDIGLLMEAARSVVRIEADRPGSGLQMGTGVVLADGEIATACHVVRGARAVHAIYAGRRLGTSNMRVMAARDVCAFSVVGLEAPPARVRPSVHLQIGEPVTALGFSGGAGIKWKTGEIVRKHRFTDSVIIQSTTPFTSGASGGPLLDAEGNVVGLLIFRTRGPSPQFYAVPIEWGVDVVELSAGHAQASTRFSTLPFWDSRGDALPFFMRASSLEAAQRWDELRLLCEMWQVDEPSSGEPAFVESQIDEHFGRFDAVQNKLVEAVERDAQHVLAWASLVRVRLYMQDVPGANSAYSRLRKLNVRVANQFVENGLITAH
jgi:serine protease Do